MAAFSIAPDLPGLVGFLTARCCPPLLLCSVSSSISSDRCLTAGGPGAPPCWVAYLGCVVPATLIARRRVRSRLALVQSNNRPSGRERMGAPCAPGVLCAHGAQSSANPGRSASPLEGLNLLMRLPESLFLIINPMMRILLRSPLHFVQSKSLMLITFTGKKSGRRFTTPVRYVRVGDTVRCFTSPENLWWRNLRGGAAVSLRIEGDERPYWATIRAPAAGRDALVHYLGLFPQDAAYHGIRLNPDRSLVAEDLERESQHAVVVEARATG